MEMYPPECARRGDLTYFKNAEIDDILGFTDDQGDSVFSIAAKANHVDCCKEIYARCPSIIYQRSSDYRYTALHHAAWRGNTKLIEFLISVAAKTPFEDIESGEEEVPNDKRLLRMLDDYGASALDTAISKEKYDAAKLLVEADPGFEHGGDEINIDTSLMRAVRVSYGKSDNSSAVKIRRLLLQNKPNLSNVHSALQDATEKGEVSAVLDIIRICPECLELVDGEGQNFLHHAAKLGHAKVLKASLKTKALSGSVLNAQDSNGNTPLHLAALSESANMTTCTEVLFYHPKVDKRTVNKMGQQVEEAVHEQERLHGIRLGVNENELKNQSDFDLVVCALIATISFTSGIVVPGGYISDGPNSGMAILSKKTSFMIFIISNTFALLFSLYAVFSHFCTRHLPKKKDIELQVKVATFCTLGAIFAMVVASIAGSYVVLAISKGLALAVCAMCGTFFPLALWPMGKMSMKMKCM